MAPIRSSDKMVDTGLLVLGRRALPLLSDKLAAAATCVRSRLYVWLEPRESPESLRELVPKIYLHASQKCAHIDVRVLLRPEKGRDYGVLLKDIGESAIGEDAYEAHGAEKDFKHVCLGGTFDRLHNGHKVLLSTAALYGDKVTCGVTAGEMNRKKTLYELMEPLESRVHSVESFLADVSYGLNVNVEEIYDPFGPAIVYPDLDCIVVSEETVKGGEAVNTKRIERGLSQMAIRRIDLVDGADEILHEVKLSSSTRRRQLLGTLLRAPDTDLPGVPLKPYVIGLTGGIASGKTHISKFLKTHGCEVADCDAIVHELYAGLGTFTDDIAKEFGAECVVNGAVDRKKLGEIIFADKSKREKLQSLIWPAVKAEVEARLARSTADIFVIDAALLIEAGWTKHVRQIWTTFVPRAEAIKRIIDRDGLSPEAAEARINAQLSNEDRIALSHVVFCSLWEYSETERQFSLYILRLCNANRK
uniref:CTP_transf_like domain-containing protein n=1 Tax=Panagrellus redivivus TaxID=6233 RepID=A0A7E4ZY55_PANRE